MADGDSEPIWLSRDNDHIHKNRVSDETEPLFGSGKIPLEGEVKDPITSEDSDGCDVESQSQKNYGSIGKEPLLKDDNSSAVPSSKSGKKTKAWYSIFDDEVSTGAGRTGNNVDVVADENSTFADDDDSRTLLTLDSKPHMPKRGWCLFYFRVVAGVTVISSLGLLTTQIIPLVVAPLKEQGYFDLALKLYISLFCLLFLLVEFDSPVPAIRNSQLLQTYLSRGFLYSFLGLICLEEAYSERVKEIVKVHADEFHVAWASLFMQISSWLIFSCGVLYMLMGLCCLKKLRDKIRKKDQQVWKKYRQDLKEWKRLNL